MLGVILLTLVAQRQCGVAQVQSYGYQARAVAAAPVYQQTYTYQQPAYADVVQFVAVADPYYSEVVGQQMRAENKAKAALQTEIDLATQVTKLADAVARLEARVSTPQPPPVTPFSSPAPPTKELPPPPPVKSAPPPTPSAQIPSAQAPETFSADAPPPPPMPAVASTDVPPRVVEIFRANCLKCHQQGDGLKGDFALFDTNGNFIRPAPLDMIAIDQQTYSGKMPPKKPLDEQTYSDLKSWMNQSHDEIMDFVKGSRSPKTVK